MVECLYSEFVIFQCPVFSQTLNNRVKNLFQMKTILHLFLLSIFFDVVPPNMKTSFCHWSVRKCWRGDCSLCEWYDQVTLVTGKVSIFPTITLSEKAFIAYPPLDYIIERKLFIRNFYGFEKMTRNKTCLYQKIKTYQCSRLCLRMWKLRSNNISN